MRIVIFIIAITLGSTAFAQCLALDAIATQYGISFVGIAKSLPLTSQPEQIGTQDKNVALVQFKSHANIVKDGFEHAALIDANRKLAWILQTGGFAGVYQWYGPVAITEIDFSECRGAAVLTRNSTETPNGARQ